ncbi:hypothetical protein [Methanoculleus chikugoensis]|uniref:hypothetical protein n=1 Tax=Methanoculleus chikugoensis TaxID=118126 RepID=UPI000A6FF045|nr:hypothetical protein [Methanoculleus chikugoensis]
MTIPPLGSLSYTSSNRYWVDQTWTYQMGAVFLSQDGGTTVRVGPSIAAAKTADENITLTVARSASRVRPGLRGGRGRCGSRPGCAGATPPPPSAGPTTG